VPSSGSIPELPHVEKVGRTFGICAFGGFDAAEPAVGFYGRWIGGGGSMQTQLT